MPWTIKGDYKACPTGKKWAVVNKKTGRVMGCHASQAHALRQLAALYANVPEARREK